jgi:two-component system chemotaxis sensor kinase CheA
MSGPDTPRALDDFLSEAQEIIEGFNRSLLRLDEDLRGNRFDPEVLNEAFRAMHSLKGLAGLFGVARMVTLSHHLESVLDALRLGRLDLDSATLDLLFEAVERATRIVQATAQGGASDDASLDPFIARVEALGARERRGAESDPWGGYRFEESMLAVLTEYEEHRLRENVRLGRSLYRLHAVFDLLSIDRGLDELKARVRPLGEVITYLPSTESASENQIELDVVLGSERGLDEVRAAVGDQVGVTRFERATGAPAADPAPAPRPAAPQPSPAVRAEVPEEAPETTLRSVAQSVRVDIRKLDNLMNVVGELTLVRAGLSGVLERLRLGRQVELARALQQEMRALERRIDELQAGILEVRMVPLGQVFDKLSRVVRRISRDAKKDIRLHISGADTELDKLIVEELSDPLMHVIRNCIDHGIEPPEVRQRLGKPKSGTIAIVAGQRGKHVVIDIEDDGAGLDEQRLVDKAIQRGSLDAGQARELSRREVFNLIFLPGVSTKEVADQVSGRGVGMDVVKTNIARLSGMIEVDSTRGRGTKMTITLPITLAIIQALVIRAAGRTYAMSLNSVLESLRVDAGELFTIERREALSLRGQTLPLVRLERLFELERGRDAPPPGRQFVVVIGLAQHRVGLLVDELVGQEDIVVKPLGRALGAIPGIAGATSLGGDQVVLVLDVPALVEEALGVGQVEAA